MGIVDEYCTRNMGVYISNEEFEQVSQPVKLYNHYESKKAECTPDQLKPIEDFLNIAQMF